MLQAKQIKDGNTSLTNELRQLDRTDSEVLEDFIKKYSTILPDTHQVYYINVQLQIDRRLSSFSLLATKRRGISRVVSRSTQDS